MFNAMMIVSSFFYMNVSQTTTLSATFLDVCNTNQVVYNYADSKRRALLYAKLRGQTTKTAAMELFNTLPKDILKGMQMPDSEVVDVILGAIKYIEWGEVVDGDDVYVYVVLRW